MSRAGASARPLFAEALGTALLLAAVVGSGAMAEQLAAGNAALALLANAMATAAALAVIILVLGPVSGAHLNPVVTMALALAGRMPRGRIAPYVLAQLAGAVAGTVVANLMFGLPAVAVATEARAGFGQLLSEGVATFGLVLVVLGSRPATTATTAASVALYIGAAYWFTASTSFANPAATIARSLTDSFTGIAPQSIVPFIGAEVLGALLALAAARLLWLRANTTRGAAADGYED